jgi:aromatic-L-amino-acid decarboxylase
MLELSADQMHGLVDEAMRRIVEHITSLPGQPAHDVDGAMEVARSVIEREPPERGTAAGVLLDEVFRLAKKSFNAAGPGYLAYIPGGGLFPSAVADLVADSLNRYTGVCAAAPALVQLETNVIRWFCRMAGYDQPSAGGFLTTGGSLANFTAVVTARRDRLPENFLHGTIYASDQVHHSVLKAAALAGFPAANVREVATDERFRMRVDSLSERLAADRAAGMHPFLLVASAGTTNSGAVDDLEALAAVARSEDLWLHVDGAYGGFFVLTERGRATLKGIEQADSITLDPHKTLFLPFGTGSLLVRDAATLQRAHGMHAEYLPELQREAELVDFCEISPELSRDFRGLRVWLPLKMYGLAAFRAELDEKLDLIAWATAELRAIPGIEIVAEPQLTIVAFLLHREGIDDDTLNRRLLEKINARKRVMLTPTVLRGRFVIRLCIVSFRTHMDRMQMCMEDIRAAIEEVDRGTIAP